MEESGFVSIASLLCEPSRAKMLWHLLDGRAYTAGELAIVTDSTATAASNHLSKLLKGNIIRVDVQGRHRYYSFATPEVAYVVESLASLSRGKSSASDNRAVKSGIKYCRTCYDHLAGYVGVAVVEALEKRLCLIKS